MKKSFARYGLLAALLGAALSGCGGGSAGSAMTAAGSNRPMPTPTPSSAPRYYQVRVVIGFSGTRQSQTVPGSGEHSAAVAKGARDGGPLAGARVTYPDGSVQVADASGVFLPASSPYALKNQKVLQTNPQAQPLIIVSDPAGKVRPSTARVAAYASSRPAVLSVARHTLGTPQLATVDALAGVSLLQATSSMFSSDYLDLDVQGSDAHDNVVDLSTATVSYSAASGTVVQIPGTTQAYYFPPEVDSGSQTDTISVTVTPPLPAAPQFSASNQVVVVASASALTVGGTIRTASGTPIPQSLALFAQLSRFFAPNYWLAGADDSGAYVAQVPQGQQFSLVVGAAAPYAPTPDFNVFVGSTDAAGSTTSYASPTSASAALDLYLPPNPVIFNNAPSDSLPAYVGFVRDAWYNTVDATNFRVFDAQSGIQPLLANVPSSFPSPATPAPLGSGQYATWCYQWQQQNGAASLVVVEAIGPNCTQPGNDGFVVTPGPASTYSYVKYASNTLYAIGSTLDVATNAMLVESGTWSQTLNGPPVAPVSYTAGVQSQLYDAANQTLGSPIYNDVLQYSYSLQGSGLSVEQFSNDTRTFAADNSTVAVYNATKTQVAPLASCAGTAQRCYAVSATVAEQYDPSAGAFSVNYSATTALNGDGSALLTYQTAGNPADASKVVIPLAPAAQQNTPPFCLVCPGNQASVYDADGTTKIGAFTVNNARLVQFFALDPLTGRPVDTLGFIL